MAYSTPHILQISSGLFTEKDSNCQNIVFTHVADSDRSKWAMDGLRTSSAASVPTSVQLKFRAEGSCIFISI